MCHEGIIALKMEARAPKGAVMLDGHPLPRPAALRKDLGRRTCSFRIYGVSTDPVLYKISVKPRRKGAAQGAGSAACLGFLLFATSGCTQARPGLLNAALLPLTAKAPRIQFLSCHYFKSPHRP